MWETSSSVQANPMKHHPHSSSRKSASRSVPTSIYNMFAVALRSPFSIMSVSFTYAVPVTVVGSRSRPCTNPFPLISFSNPRPLLRLVPKCAIDSRSPSEKLFHLLSPLPFVVVSAGFFCHRAFLRILPSDFSDRWHHLLEFSEGAESKVTQMPYHLIQAVMASEDRRFFYHPGVDPYGVGRAVVYYPNGGGGSTITQQLVKNVFLTHERKMSRKFVEGILSLILERRMSKWRILYAYLNKMYWGHGKFGIESACLFYFGKHPAFLNVGESALLAGILPAPEALNPYTNPRKAKYSQARVLRRMVAAGFLDLQTALKIVSQPLCLRAYGPDRANVEHKNSKRKISGKSGAKNIWDWEVANVSWEVREDMETWAVKKNLSR